MKIWVVTHAWRGLINKVWLFKYRPTAENFYKKIKSKLSKNLDEVKLDHIKVIDSLGGDAGKI